MKLHEGIIEGLLSGTTPLTAKEISQEIKRKKLYLRGDGQPPDESQVKLRIRTHPHLFARVSSSGLTRFALASASAPKKKRDTETAVLRIRYRPSQVRYLIIGESPPVNGTFFYARNSRLYRHTLQAFRDQLGPQCGAGETFLQWFCDHGWWLIDLCATPTNGLDGPTRKREWLEAMPRLAKTLETLRP